MLCGFDPVLIPHHQRPGLDLLYSLVPQGPASAIQRQTVGIGRQVGHQKQRKGVNHERKKQQREMKYDLRGIVT
jgi:hypothetical protein